MSFGLLARCFSSDAASCSDGEIWSVSEAVVGAIGAAVAGLTERWREAENKAAAVVRVTQVVLRKEGFGLDEALMAREGGGFCRIRYEVGLGWNLL